MAPGVSTAVSSSRFLITATPIVIPFLFAWRSRLPSFLIILEHISEYIFVDRRELITGSVYAVIR